MAKKLKDIVRKHKSALMKAKKTGNLDIPKNVEDELSVWASNNGEIRGDDPDEFGDWLDTNLDDLVPRLKIKESMNENYRKLAQYGMGTETSKSARVGLELDFYDSKGNKKFGKILQKTNTGYLVKDDKGKKHVLKYLDRKKAAKMLKPNYIHTENFNVMDTYRQMHEVTDKEINAVKKLSKDIEKVKKDYFKIAKMGDKTLKDTKFNKKYESILKAQQDILSLIGDLSNQKMMQKEDLNEEMITYRVKKMQKPELEKFKRSAKMMKLKLNFDQGRDDTVLVVSGTKKNLRDFDSVVRGKSSYGDPSTIKHFDEGFKSDAQRRAAFASGYKEKGKKDKKEETQSTIEKILTSDARTKAFKSKLLKLGYVKKAKEVNAVMEKIADFGMMSDGGNKKIARAVAQAKDKDDLKKRLDKISTMAGGKYSEAQEDEVYQRALDAMDSKAKGVQNRPDANILVQLRKFKDLTKDGEVRTDDMKKIKVKRDDAVKVHDALMSIRAPQRTKYLQLLQKDKTNFNKVFKAVLKVAK